MISEDLASFLQSGVSILVGTRDAQCRPEATRAYGARVEHGREELTVFLSTCRVEQTLANVQANGRVAVCFTRIIDHHAIQVKGRALEVRHARDDERPLVDRYGDMLVEILGEIGVPPRLVMRINRWPAHALRLRMQDVFVQTPGPGAGAPLGGAR